MTEQQLSPTPYAWSPGEGYYPEIATSNVSPTAHLVGRLALGVFSYVRYGRPKVVTSPGFDAMRAELQAGNNIVASIHRDDLDTVLLPSVLERVGLHHSRPMSKIELFQNRVVRWGLHKLGAFAVDRNPENVDFEGLRVAQAGILRRKDLNGDKRQGFFRRKVKNGNETIYPEGTRIHKDTLRVAKIKRGVVMTALENSSYIVPVGFAGLSSEYEGEKPHRKLKAKDKSSWFGIRRRLVFSVGTPFKLEPLSKEASADPTGKPAVKEIRKRMNIVKEAMQDEVDNAYAVRGSSLEERFD